MFITMGVLGIAVAIGWYVAYRNRDRINLTFEELGFLSDGENADNVKPSMSFSQWRGLFKSGTTWGMIFGYMIALYLSWLPAYLEHERHLTIAKTGRVVSIPYLFGTIGMVLSRFVTDGLMARGVPPIKSRKWPVCAGLIGAAAFTIPG